MPKELQILNEELEILVERESNVLFEGKMEDELVAQLGKHRIKTQKLRIRKVSELEPRSLEQVQRMAKSILDTDPTQKKSWRFKIKEWIHAGDVVWPEDMPKLNQELQLAKKFNITMYDKFKTRMDLYEFLENVKKNRGIVDERFNYTFDIDYSDKRFIIYTIQEKNKAEYIEKLGSCTTWCISTNQMFGHYDLPYYLLVDKFKEQQYAIVPSAGTFRDSKQNRSASHQRFEEFDEILNLRERYYSKVIPAFVDDEYIYEDKFVSDTSEKFQIALLDKVPSVIDHIKDPSENVKEAMAEHLLDSGDIDELTDAHKKILGEFIFKVVADNSKYADAKEGSITFSFNIFNDIDELEDFYLKGRGNSDVSFEFFTQVIKGETSPVDMEWGNITDALAYSDINAENTKTIEQFLDKEYTDWRETYDDVKEAILGDIDGRLDSAVVQAYGRATESATEGKIYGDAEQALTDAGFEINWDTSEISLTITDVEFLYYYHHGQLDAYDSEEFLIKFEQPHYGWDESPSDELFNEALADMLSEEGIE